MCGFRCAYLGGSSEACGWIFCQYPGAYRRKHTPSALFVCLLPFPFHPPSDSSLFLERATGSSSCSMHSRADLSIHYLHCLCQKGYAGLPLLPLSWLCSLLWDPVPPRLGVQIDASLEFPGVLCREALCSIMDVWLVVNQKGEKKGMSQATMTLTLSKRKCFNINSS